MYLEKYVFYIPIIFLIATWVYLYFLERGVGLKFIHYEEEFLKELRRKYFELSEKNRIKDRELKETLREINRELTELIKAKKLINKEIGDLKRPSNAVKEDILQNFVWGENGNSDNEKGYSIIWEAFSIWNAFLKADK